MYLIAKLGKSNQLLGITDASRMDLARVLFHIRVYFFDRLFFSKMLRVNGTSPGPVQFGTCICSNVETILS